MKNKSQLIILVAGIVLGMLAMFLFTGKKENPEIKVSHEMIVDKIERLGNLEVVKFHIQDVIEYEKMRRWLPNAKTALVVSGEIIGCIDLTKLRPEDIYTSADSVRLHLPAPEICHVKIDHNKSKVFNTEYALWDTSKIVDEAYRAAEVHLQEEAQKLDFETQSRSNTLILLQPILEAMGFKHVLITFDSTDYSEKGKR